VIVPVVTETVTGTLMLTVPSEMTIEVEPLAVDPIPIDVAANVPTAAVAESVIDAGLTVTIVVSLLVAVIVPVKPLSVTTMF
jgi:hypothetical protein